MLSTIAFFANIEQLMANPLDINDIIFDPWIAFDAGYGSLKIEPILVIEFTE